MSLGCEVSFFSPGTGSDVQILIWAAVELRPLVAELQETSALILTFGAAPGVETRVGPLAARALANIGPTAEG